MPKSPSLIVTEEDLVKLSQDPVFVAWMKDETIAVINGNSRQYGFTPVQLKAILELDLKSEKGLELQALIQNPPVA